jgi:hypothetical protein
MSFWDAVNVLASKASEALSTLSGEGDDSVLRDGHGVDEAEELHENKVAADDIEQAQIQEVRAMASVPMVFFC